MGVLMLCAGRTMEEVGGSEVWFGERSIGAGGVFGTECWQGDRREVAATCSCWRCLLVYFLAAMRREGTRGSKM